MIRRAWALFSVVPIFVGASVVLGCLTGFSWLVDLNTHYFSLEFNTAICFLLSGIALFSYLYSSDIAEYVQIIMGTLIVIIAGATISQDMLNIDLHIDNFVATSGLTDVATLHPTRMAPNTALTFILLGFAYMLIPIANRKIIGLGVGAIIFFALLISILSFFGYVLKEEFLYNWFGYRNMPLLTSICLVCISLALSALWRMSPVSTELYRGREDTRIILLSCAILFCMAIAITLINFISLIQQENATIGESFQKLQKSRSIFFQNEVVHAIQETNVIRDSQVFQEQMSRSNETVSFSDFQPILKLFSAEGYSAVAIYNAEGKQQASVGHFVQQAVFNIKEKITNGYINILWKDGWYVQIVGDVMPNNKKAGMLIVEWPLLNVNKVFSPNQVMGQTGDMLICMPVSKMNVTCYSSRKNAVSVLSENNQFMPMTYAMQGQSGLVTADNGEYKSILTAYGPVGVLGLGLIVEMSVAEIYAPILQSLKTLIPIVGMMILIGLILLRLQVVPLLRRVINAEKGLMNSNKRLEESEARYALVVRGSSIGLWDWDVAKNTVFYSPYFKGMLGYADNEFPNNIESFKKALHPDDLVRVFDHIEQQINSRIPYDVEFRMKRKTGEYHWFQAKGLALSNDDGVILRVAGSILDITERKKSEQRLTAQYAVIQLLSTAAGLEEIAEKIVQALGECLECDFGALSMVDSQTSMMRCIGVWYRPIPGIQSLVDVMRRLESPLGVGLAGRVWETGQHLWVFDVSIDKNIQCVEQVREAGLHSAFCFPIRIQNKVLGALEFMMRQRQSPEEAMLKMMTAITTQLGIFVQRKQIEGNLRESESYKAAILESAFDSIMTIDANGVILSFNHRTSEIFGYSSLELKRSNIDVLMPDLSGTLKYLVARVSSEVPAKRKNGEVFSVEITVSKMYLGKQNVFVCIVRDILERKKLERIES